MRQDAGYWFCGEGHMQEQDAELPRAEFDGFGPVLSADRQPRFGREWLRRTTEASRTKPQLRGAERLVVIGFGLSIPGSE